MFDESNRSAEVILVHGLSLSASNLSQSSQPHGEPARQDRQTASDALMPAGNFDDVSALIPAPASLPILDAIQHEQGTMPTALLGAWCGDLSFPAPVSSLQNFVLSESFNSRSGPELGCHAALNTGPSLVSGTSYTDFSLPLNLNNNPPFHSLGSGASLSWELPLSLNQHYITALESLQALMPTGLSFVTPGNETGFWEYFQTSVPPQVGESIPEDSMQNHARRAGGSLRSDPALAIKQPEYQGRPEPDDALSWSLEQRLVPNRHPQPVVKKISGNQNRCPRLSEENRPQRIISRKRARTALPRYARAETAETRELAACIRCQRVKKRVKTQWRKKYKDVPAYMGKLTVSNGRSIQCSMSRVSDSSTCSPAYPLHPEPRHRLHLIPHWYVDCTILLIHHLRNT